MKATFKKHGAAALRANYIDATEEGKQIAQSLKDLGWGISFPFYVVWPGKPGAKPIIIGETMSPSSVISALDQAAASTAH